MTQEDKEILLKDICARVPYGVIVDNGGRYNYSCYLTTDILKEIQYGAQHYDIKPYLRPMSSMTDEEVKEFHHMASMERDYLGDGNFYTHYRMIDWLLANHFDYHGLIEKGLALEAKKGMYE